MSRTTLRAPRLWRLASARGGVELRLFFRAREAVLSTFALPVVLLVMLGTIFDGPLPGAASGGEIYTAGLLVLAIGSAAFVNLGMGVAVDRDDGTLARLRRVPAPAAAYLLGKIILVLVTSLTGVALLLATGAVHYGLALPTDPSRWLIFAMVFLLGGTACGLLGMAVSGLARTVRAAGAVMSLPYLALNFLSGVLVPITVLPENFRAVGAVFPLKWMAQGFRSVFLPDELAAFEPAGSWEHGRIAAVLAAWCIGGMVLCLKTFRWRDPADG